MITCPRCQRDSTVWFTTTDLNQRVSDQEFTYYRCTACGVGFLHPVPVDLEAYYPGNYYALPTRVEDLAHYGPDEHYKLDMIRPFAPNGKLFEVGPSVGVFAYLAKQAGYQVEVMEMDRACCDFLETVLGIPAVHSADIRASLDGRGQYDVITLWHVIEHLPDPWFALPTLVEHLAPGGALVIAAPNPRAFQFRVLGRRWAHVDAPRHLEMIPAQLLIDDLAMLGLRLALTTTTDPRGRYLDRFGWQYSLHNLANHSVAKRLLRGLGLICSIGALPIERRPMRGSAYTLILTKDSVDHPLSRPPGVTG